MSHIFNGQDILEILIGLLIFGPLIFAWGVRSQRRKSKQEAIKLKKYNFIK